MASEQILRFLRLPSGRLSVGLGSQEAVLHDWFLRRPVGRASELAEGGGGVQPAF